MSEIANGVHSGALVQRKPAISECLKSKGIFNKPEICKANLSVHAQEHAPPFRVAVLDKLIKR